MVKNLGLDYEKIDACPNFACCLGMIIRMMNFVILVELHDKLNLLKLIVNLSLKKTTSSFSKDLDTLYINSWTQKVMYVLKDSRFFEVS